MRLNKRIIALSISMVFCSHTLVWSESTATTTTNLPILKHSTVKNTPLINFLYNENISSLDQYIVWFKNNMTYKSDGKNDRWASPHKTIKTLSGDCEDLAFLNKAVLELFGIEAKVLGTQKGEDHHVFCVFKYNDRIYIFDNTDCIKTKARNLDQIASFLYGKYNVDYILEVDIDPKTIKVLYSKSMMQRFAKTLNPFPAS